MVMRIGLTGGIAAGKSTVAAHLKERGAFIIDYDELARKVVAPGGETLQRIAVAFGDDVIRADGSLDRDLLARRVFGDGAGPGARERLDAIEHPMIYREAQREERGLGADGGTTSLVVHDVPLLAEVIGSIPFTFDHVMTVEAPVGERVRRMVETRGMSQNEAMDRIDSQVDEAARLEVADVVVNATQPIEQMFEYLDTLVAQWSSMGAR